MKKLKHSFQTEIQLTPQQKNKFFETRGVCRFVYNMFLAQNQEWYEQGKKYMSARDFSVWLNNEYIPNNPDKIWIKKAYSKAVKQSLENAHKAYIRFFKGESKFPKFKKKGKNEPKIYFVRNNKTDCICERHRLKIPSFGWVQLKEKGYIPTSKNGYIISSGTIKCIAGRFYVSALVEIPNTQTSNNPSKTDGIGVDLGIKNLAVISDGSIYKNINKTLRVKKLEKKLKREQKRLSRKYENKKKGVVTQEKNILKQIERLQKIHHTLANIRDNYIKTVVNEMVKTKPSYITIEDLNVKGMIKNKHLSKAIQQQEFYRFRQILTQKCKDAGIELRIVNRWFPSSKICNHCGRTNKNLKLSERVYKCDCGYIADRDFNASLNLKDATIYEIA